MSRDLEGIRRVVAAFEQSDWAEIDVRFGAVRVHLVAGEHGATAASHLPSTASPSPVRPPVGDDRGAVPAARTAEPPPDGAHLVVSPSPGIFWRSPEPGAPPFAEVGDRVDMTSTMCIVEVMKLMNHIKADVHGVVVAVYGENGVAVQQGEPLFAIVPAGPGT